MFHKGCCIDILAEPFRNGGWPPPLPIFGDHTPISNEMSASVYKSSPLGRKTGISDT
jgi:hypothetical protein